MQTRSKVTPKGTRLQGCDVGGCVPALGQQELGGTAIRPAVSSDSA